MGLYPMKIEIDKTSFGAGLPCTGKPGPSNFRC